MTPTRLSTVEEIITKNLEWDVIDSQGKPVHIASKNVGKLLACYKSKLTIIAGEPKPRLPSECEITLWDALRNLHRLFKDYAPPVLTFEEEQVEADASLQITRWEKHCNKSKKND